jgi:hypothetical protein
MGDIRAVRMCAANRLTHHCGEQLDSNRLARGVLGEVARHPLAGGCVVWVGGVVLEAASVGVGRCSEVAAEVTAETGTAQASKRALRLANVCSMPVWWRSTQSASHWSSRPCSAGGTRSISQRSSTVVLSPAGVKV